MNDSDLAAARAIADAATPGPWGYTEGYYGINANGTRYLDRVANANGMDDTRFIAASRSLVPLLVTEIENLRAALTEIAYWGQPPSHGHSLGYEGPAAVARRALDGAP